MPKSKDDNVMVLDPKMYMERMLHYRERHHGWMLFQTSYWAIYITVISIILLSYGDINLTPTVFLGIAGLLLAVMLVIYGMVTSLHLKFMKKYG
ncbi:MAG: hypothetical protein KGH72_00170 [Candidatus Micrarchaeota archaeon]|nr:hypothetical protein [Candidatus Micrarchaeota archaeon]